MNRATRRASLAAFKHDAAKTDVITFLIDGSDTALLRKPFAPAVLHWRSNVSSRKPKCATACGASFAGGASVGGWLFAQPEGTNAISVSAFCLSCWSNLDDDELERVAVKVLGRIKPGARFSDAPS